MYGSELCVFSLHRASQLTNEKTFMRLKNIAYDEIQSMDIKKGFPNVKILKGKNNNFRISINDFPTLTDAKNGKNKLGEKYQSAWILQY